MHWGKSSTLEGGGERVTARIERDDVREAPRISWSLMHAASLVCCNQDASRYQALTARSPSTSSRIDVGR